MPRSKKKKPGAYTPPFTDPQRKAIVAAYNKGDTLEGLAAKYGCSTSKVRKVLKEHKVKMRPRGPVAKEQPKAKKASKPRKPKAVAKEVIVKRTRKPLSDAQRAAKNARDKERRAAKKAGLNATLAAVATPNQVS